MQEECRDWYIDSRYCLTGNGRYSITLGYEKLIGTAERWEIAELLWNKYAVPKHSFISWLIVQNRIMTKDRLQSRGVDLEDMNCILCRTGSPESTEHLFIQCTWINDIWKEMQNWLGVQTQNNGIKGLLLKIKKKKWVRDTKELIATAYEAVVYQTWIARNSLIFRKKRLEEANVIQQVKNEMKERVQTTQ